MTDHPALVYAARGWPVVPLHSMRAGACSCGQANDATGHTPGKHPRTANGLKDATTDAAKINGWLAAWPDMNLAICTGDVFVIDIDPGKGGADTWAKITDGKPREDLDTVRQKTGGDGLHFLFRNPPAEMFHNSAGLLGPGIDTRGVGGYIVVDPSNHKSGGSYQWIKGHAPGDHDLLPLPTWLIASLKSGKKNGHSGLVPIEIGERIPRGRRDSTMLSKAGSDRSRGLPQAVIESGLLELNKLCDPPLAVARVLDLARRYRTSKGDLPAGVLRGDGLQDMDSGVRLATMFGHEFRYVHEWKWMVWEDGRWIRDTKGRMEEYAKQVVRTMHEAALQIDEDGARKAMIDAARKSSTMPKLLQMIASARSEPGIHANVEDFDSHDDLLNVKNGVVELLTGKLRSHDPNLYLTGAVDIAYDPFAVCPRWESFIHEFCKGDRLLMEYVQRAVGYSLTGYTTEQVLFFLFGDGSNGKSKFIAVVTALLGSLGAVMNFSTLLAGRDNNTENALASLVGKRIATAIEAGAGRAFNEELLKAMTGGDKVRARFMYADGFDYVPKFKVWLAANDQPGIKGADHGIWRRLHPIPCRNHVEDHKQDKGLEAKLMAELPGILAWAVRGAMDWNTRGGLYPPDCVVKAVEDYRNENDTFKEFLAERCVIGAELSVTAADLQAAQVAWSEDRREKPMTPQALGRRLTKFNAGLFTKKKHDGGYTLWLGLTLGRPKAPAAQVPLDSSLPAIVGPTAAQQDRMTMLLELVRVVAAQDEKGIATETRLEQELGLQGWSPSDVGSALRQLRERGMIYCKLGAGTYAPMVA